MFQLLFGCIFQSMETIMEEKELKNDKFAFFRQLKYNKKLNALINEWLVLNII